MSPIYTFWICWIDRESIIGGYIDGLVSSGLNYALNVDIACTENQPCKLSVPVGHPELCVHFGLVTTNKGGVERIIERIAADA